MLLNNFYTFFRGHSVLKLSDTIPLVSCTFGLTELHLFLRGIIDTLKFIVYSLKYQTLYTSL